MLKFFTKHSKQRPFVVAISKLSIHNQQGMNKMGLESKRRNWLLIQEKKEQAMRTIKSSACCLQTLKHHEGEAKALIMLMMKELTST